MSPTPPTPATLLQKLRLPDAQAAWARFVDLYSPFLFLWTVRNRLPAQEAADFVQDVFVRLLNVLPTYDFAANGSFRAWLRTLLRNLWRDRCKAAAVRAHVGAAPLDEVPAPQADALLEEAEHRRHLVARALQIIKGDFEPPTWQAFEGVTTGGRDAATVANELGLTPAKVYAARHRVLCRLREELAGLLD